MKIAALYVEKPGIYTTFGDDVETWGVEDDARRYEGPYPVVAHPPCNRWSTLAAVVEAKGGERRGKDGGTFRAALRDVRDFGGILEHPANSAAWQAHKVPYPGAKPDAWGGYSVLVYQSAWGHVAPKATWLYVCGVWLPPIPVAVADPGGRVVDMRPRDRLATPPRFAEWLIAAARTAYLVRPGQTADNDG